MENFTASKLWLLFATLSARELRQLRNFLRSPYYTRREDIFLLFQYLRREGNRKQPAPEAAAAFQATFPAEPFDGLKLRGTMSDLMELIEQYLLSRHFEKEKLPARFALAAIYRQRGLDKHFHWTMKKLQRQVSQLPHEDASFQGHRLDYLTEWMYFHTHKRRTGELNLQEVSVQMDRHYLARKLRHACTQLTHQAVYNRKYDFGLLEKMLEGIEDSGLLDTPAISIYYYCYRFLTEAYSLHYFQRFRAQLLEHVHLFPEYERKSLYLLAINFCIRQLNRSSTPFAREAWEMYRIGLSQGFLLENGELSRFTFNNIVGIALKLGETAWAGRFIEEYHGLVSEEFRQAAWSLNQARLAYAKGEWGDAIMRLQGAEYGDLVTNIIARMLLIKIYYLQGAYDALDAQLASLENFVRRGAFSSFHRENYLNNARFIKRLLALPEYDSRAREKLRKEIERTDPLSEKEWLLEQL